VGEGLRVFCFNHLHPAASTRRVQRSRSTLPGPRLTRSPIQGLSAAAPLPIPYFRPAPIDELGWTINH
jgi:hypothetical protein